MEMDSLFVGSSAYSYASDDDDGELGTSYPSDHLVMNDAWMFHGIDADVIRSIEAGTFATHDSGHLVPSDAAPVEGPQGDGVADPTSPPADSGSAVVDDPLPYQVLQLTAATHVGAVEAAGIFTSDMDCNTYYDDDVMGNIYTRDHRVVMADSWILEGIDADLIEMIGTGTFSGDNCASNVSVPIDNSSNQGLPDLQVHVADATEEAGPTEMQLIASPEDGASADGSAVDDLLPDQVLQLTAATHVGAAGAVESAGITDSDMDYTSDDDDDVMGNSYTSDHPVVMADSWIIAGIGNDLIEKIATGTYSGDISASKVSVPNTDSSNLGPDQVDVADPSGEAGPTVDDGLAAGVPTEVQLISSPHVSVVEGAALDQSIVMENDVNYAYGGDDVSGNSYTAGDQGEYVMVQGPQVDVVDLTEDDDPAEHNQLPEVELLIDLPHVGAVASAVITSGSGSGNLNGDEGSSPAYLLEISDNNADESHGELGAHSPTSDEVVTLHGDDATAGSLVPPAPVPAGPANGANSSGKGKRKRQAKPRAPKKLKKMVGGKVFKYHGVIERAGCNVTFKVYFRPSSLPDSDNKTVVLGEFSTESEAWKAFNLMAFVHEGEDATMNDPDIRAISEEAAAWSDCHRVALLAHLRLRGRGTYTDGTTPKYRSIKCSESSKGRITYSCNVTLNPGVVDPNRQAANGEKEKQTFESAEEAARMADRRKYLNEGEAAWTNFSLVEYMAEAGIPLDKAWLPLTNDPKKYLSTSKKGRSFDI